MLSLFNFKRKAKAENALTPIAETKMPVFTDEAKTELSHFIIFALNEEDKGNILLGKRTNGKGDDAEVQYFICFRNEQINGFLGEWYNTLKESRNPNSTFSKDKDYYNFWLNHMLNKYKINTPATSEQKQNTDK